MSVPTIRQVLGAKNPGEKPSKQSSKTKGRLPAQPAAPIGIGKRRTLNLKPDSDGPKRPFGGHELSKMVKRQVVFASAKGGIVGCLYAVENLSGRGFRRSACR